MGQAEEEPFDALMVDLILFSFKHILCYLLTLIQMSWKTVIMNVCVCVMIFLLICQEKHRSTTFTFTDSYEHKCFFSKH